MDQTPSKLRIQTLKAQVEAASIHCEALHILIEAQVARAQKTAFTFRWDQARGEYLALRAELESLESADAEAEGATQTYCTAD